MVAAVGKLRGESRGFCRGKGMKELDLAGKAVAWYCLSGPQTMGPGMFVLSEEVARGIPGVVGVHPEHRFSRSCAGETLRRL